MKWNTSKHRPLLAGLTVAALALNVPALLAAEGDPAAGWHAQTIGQALAYMVLFAVIGIATAVAGYKLFDKCTPGDLHREILENKNIAAAIVAAAVILGLCIIIAAAMMG
jgi:putative membrane protein